MCVEKFRNFRWHFFVPTENIPNRGNFRENYEKLYEKKYMPKQMGEDQSDDLELDGPITLRILDGIAWHFAQAK